MAMAKTSGHDLGTWKTPKKMEDGAKEDAISLLGTWACKTKAKGRESWRLCDKQDKARLGLKR
jgi:hypothetical protein